MSLEEAIKAKFGKTTIVHPLLDDGCFVILDKKLQTLDLTKKRKLSANIMLVPGTKNKKETYLYQIGGHEPFAAIVSEADHDYFIIYKSKKNRELLKELRNLL